MWLRGVLTLVCLLLAGAAFALRDCVASIVGDPFGLCPVIDTFDTPQPMLVSGGLAGIAIVGLAMIWLPRVLHRRRQRKAQPEKRLIENIGRLPEFHGERQHLPNVSASTVAELTGRVEVVETAFANDSLDSRSLTTEWMQLLHEANRLHNQGTLPTEDFKELNTRLLNVVAPTTQRAAESSTA